MHRAANRGWLFRLVFLALLGMVCGRASAVEILIDGSSSFNFSDPGRAVPNWTSGWGEAGIDGWDYVGGVNGAVGVYLGDDWVMTAGHVAPGNFALGGTTYDYIQGSGQSFTTSGSTADLIIFQVANGPDLPVLQLASETSVGDNLVMIGGGGGKSWGENTITDTDVPVEVSGYDYLSSDIQTAYGPTGSGTNNAVLIPGDSGGGDFTYNPNTSQWQLAGINEAVDLSNDNSYMVQVSSYLSQIQHFTSVPEPGYGSLALLALPLLFIPVFARHKLRRVKNSVR